MSVIIFAIGFGFVFYYKILSFLRKIWIENLTHGPRFFVQYGFAMLFIFHKETRQLVMIFGIRTMFVSLIVLWLQKQHTFGTDMQELLRRTEEDNENNE